MRRQRVLTALALSIALAVAVVPSAQATVTPEKVIGGKGLQFGLIGNGTWYGWTANSTAHPRHYDAFARQVTGTTVIKINEAGTSGWTGGFDPTTNTIFYQQISKSHSDIYSFDLDTKTRMKVPGASSKTVWSLV